MASADGDGGQRRGAGMARLTSVARLQLLIMGSTSPLRISSKLVNEARTIAELK